MFGILPHVHTRLKKEKQAKLSMVMNTEVRSKNCCSQLNECCINALPWLKDKLCDCKCSFNMKNLIIDHQSKSYLVWRILIIFLSTLSSFEYAMISAYKSEFHNLGGSGPWVWGWEFLFAIDFIMKFFVDYSERTMVEGHIVQRSHKKIAIHYYQTEFWSDFIPLIPFQLIFSGK